MIKYIIASLTMTVACSGFVRAQIIPNGAFEDAPTGTYTTSGSYYAGAAGTGTGNLTGANTTLITDWTATAIPFGGYYGLVNKNVFTPSEATTGDEQGAFILDYYGGGVGTLISNSLGTITANTTYTLSLDIGAPSTITLKGSTGYTAGETAPQVYFALLGNGSAITSNTLANTSVTQNGLTNYTLTFTTGASGGYIGDDLTIKLQAAKQNYTSPPYAKADPGAEEAIFDNVTLSVPEPSTYALMLGGLGFLVLLTRRNKLKA